MLIVVGEPFSSQWNKLPQREPGQCPICQQKDATRWVTDHVYFVGHKKLQGMVGEVCVHCLNFKASEDSQKTIDCEMMRYASIVQRQSLRNIPSIQARWRARKLKRSLKSSGVNNATLKKL